VIRSARAALAGRVERGERGFIPFLTAGYPDWPRFDEAVRLLRDEGADVLELGVPFSDPLADGPTIQAASQRALEGGVTLAGILDRVEKSAPEWKLPVVLMTYANPILAYGAERFARRAVEAGVAGVLVSDLPPEELPELWQALAAAGLEQVLLVATTTRPERIARLAAAATGIVYCLTRTGVTGRGGAFSDHLAEQVRAVRSCCDLPVAAGFGIRSPEDASAVTSLVDAVVVGARLVEMLDPQRHDGLDEMRGFARSLRRALDEA